MAVCGKITAPFVFFSIAAANSDGPVHFRTVNPEQATRPTPTANDPFTIHIMGALNRDASDFDDAVITIDFGA